MARRRKLDTLDAYSRALKQGFGIGEGVEYRPWLRVNDVPTRSTCTVIRGIKTGRDHHLLSLGEKQFFLIAEFSPNVIDIREQFPLLPLDLIGQLAREMGIKYPRVPSTQEVNVQTTDFLLTLRGSTQFSQRYLAVGVKTADELKNPRSLEKLELERAWWQLMGVPYRVFVKNELTEHQAIDIEWFTASIRFSPSPQKQLLMKAARVLPVTSMQIDEAVELLIEQVNLSREEAHRVLQSLIALRYVEVDLSYSMLSTQLLTIKSKVREVKSDEAQYQ